MPVVTVPLFLTILGFRSSRKTVLGGMFAGFITVLIWKIIGIEFDPIIPAMLVNMFVMFIIHYLMKQPGGWEKQTIVENTQEEKVVPKDKFEFSFVGLKKFVYSNSPHSESVYSIFGIFCFISTLSTIYLTQKELLGDHGDLMLYFYEGMLLISVFFALHMMWSNRIRHPMVVGVMWHVALVYNLTFCTSFFLLISNLHNMQVIVFTLSTMVVFALCRWRMALAIITLGVGSGLLTYQMVIGDVMAHVDNSYHIMVYVALFFSTALLFFFKPQEEFFDAAEAEMGLLKDEVTVLSSRVGTLSGTVESKEQRIRSLNDNLNDLSNQVDFFKERVTDHEKEIERLGATSQKILNNVTHELRLPVGNVMNFAEMLVESLDKMDKNHLKDLSDEVLKNSTRLSTMILNMLDLATLDVQKVELNKKTMNLGELVKERVERCRKIYLGNKPIDFKIVIQPEVLISIDPNYMRQVVDNIIINAIKFTEKGMIEVRVTRNFDSGIIIIRDEGRGINALEMHDLFTPFKMGVSDESKAEGRGVGLALCRSAVAAHGGHIDVKSAGIGAVFTILLPMNKPK